LERVRLSGKRAPAEASAFLVRAALRSEIYENIRASQQAARWQYRVGGSPQDTLYAAVQSHHSTVEFPQPGSVYLRHTACNQQFFFILAINRMQPPRLGKQLFLVQCKKWMLLSLWIAPAASQ
jgi:hypothetical protein